MASKLDIKLVKIVMLFCKEGKLLREQSILCGGGLLFFQSILALAEYATVIDGNKVSCNYSKKSLWWSVFILFVAKSTWPEF